MKHTCKLFLFTALLALALACILGISVSADTHSAATAEELTNAIGSAAAGDTIELTANIAAGATIAIDKSLTFTSDSAVTLSYDSTDAPLFQITADNVTLTLTGNASFNAGQRVVYVDNTTYANVVITVEGNATARSRSNSALYVMKAAGSTINVRGNAKIYTSDEAFSASAYDAIIVNNSGTGSVCTVNIGDNAYIKARRYAVHLQRIGEEVTLNISGTPTLTSHTNAVIFVSSDMSAGRVVNMTVAGGTIIKSASQNSNYGAIAFHNGSCTNNFTMTGGEITSVDRSALSFTQTTSVVNNVTITGGKLSVSYTATDSWRGVVDIAGSGVVVIGGSAQIIDAAKNRTTNGLILRQGTAHDVTIEGNARIEAGYYGIHVWYQPVSLDLKIKDNAYIGCSNSGGGIIVTMKNASSITIAGGTVYSPNGPALNISNNKDGLTGSTPIIVSGATLSGSTYGIYTHALAQVPSISISNATVTGGTCALQTNAAVGTINITQGSVLTGTASSGVQIKGNTNITVADSTVTGGLCALDLSEAVGETANAVTVAGSTLTAGAGAALVLGENVAEVTVLSGTLQGTTYGLLMPGSLAVGDTLTVRGGTFTGDSAGIYLARGATVQLHGGVFAGGAYGIVFGADAVSDASNADVEFYSGDFTNVDMMLRLETSLSLTVGLPDDYTGAPLPEIVLPTSGGIYVRTGVEIWDPIFLSDDLQDLQTIDDLAYYDTYEHLSAGFVGYIEGDEPQYFTTIEGGIQLAEDGDVIVLLKNVIAALTLQKSCTFSGNVTLSGTAGAPLFTIAADDVVLTLQGDLILNAETVAQVTADGAKIVIGGNVAVVTTGTALIVDNDGSAIIEGNATVSATGTAIMIGENGSATIGGNAAVSATSIGVRLAGNCACVTVRDSAAITVSSVAIALEGADVVVTVRDNAVVRSTSTSGVSDSSTAAGGAVVFRSGSVGEVNIEGGLVTANTFVVRFYAAGTLNFSGGVISQTDTASRDAIHVATAVPRDQHVTINMTGGTLASLRYGLYVMGNVDMTMTGGSFTAADLTSTSCNFWNEYENAGQDPALHHIVIGGDAKITTGANVFRFIADEAYVTFGGNAEITARYIAYGINTTSNGCNGGSQYITVQENAKLTASLDGFQNASVEAGHKLTLTVTGGEITCGNLLAGSVGAGSVFTMTGGAVTVGSGTVVNYTGADCVYNISGGTFAGAGLDYGFHIRKASTLTITGGVFRTLSAAVCVANENAVITVESGDFTNANAILLYTVSNANVTLGKAGAAITLPTAGLLYVLPAADAAQPVCAIDGITPYTENGIFYYDTEAHAQGGEIANAVAYIMVGDDPVYYLTLAAAIEAANANDAQEPTVIVLRKSFKLDAQIEVFNKKFTLTGENITVTAPDGDTSGRRIFHITGAATITVAGSVELLAYNRVFQIDPTEGCSVSIIMKDNAKATSQANAVIVNETASAVDFLSILVQDNAVIRTDDNATYTIYTVSPTTENTICVSDNGMLDSWSRVIQSNGRTDILITGGVIRQRSTTGNIDGILLDAGTPDDQVNTFTMTGGEFTVASRYGIYARNATTLHITGGTITCGSVFYNEWINTASTNYTPTKTVIHIGGNTSITASTIFQIISEDAEVTISDSAVLTASQVGVQFGTNAGKGVLSITGTPTITAGRYAVNYQGADTFAAVITGGTLIGGRTEDYSGVRVADTTTGASVAVSGATKIFGAASAIWMEKGGVTVWNGTLLAKTGNAIGMINGTVTVYGGTFRSSNAGIWIGSASSTVTLDLRGGSFVLSGEGVVIRSLNDENVLNLGAFNAVGGAAVLKNAAEEIVIAYENEDKVYARNTIANAGGAQVRLTAGSSGLRFIGTMSAEAIAYLAAIGASDIAYGTLILPTDFLAGADAFTAADLDRAGIPYLNVIADQGLIGSGEEGYAIRAAMINIRKMNYGRDFSAVAYVTYTVNGQQVTQYAAYTAQASSRSVAYVAAMALADVHVAYTAEQRVILQGYAACYTGAPVAMMPTATAAPVFGKKAVA